MRYIAWLIFFLIVSLVGEFLAEFTNVLNTDEELKPAAVVWFILLGLAGGFATAAVVPDRLLPPGPFEGISVLILPIFLGAGLAVVGLVRGAARTHFASWYGGAAVGLGLAVGRLIGLAFVAEVRLV